MHKMETYKIATVCVSGATAVAIDPKPIPRGITGAVVELLYDDDIWAGLRKKVAFRGSGEVEILCDGDTVIFPAEVAQRGKVRVTVGITGVSDDDTVIIPTLWADLGSVWDSAYGNYPAPGEPVPPLWAQLLTMIGDLKNLDTEAKDNLVNAVNEAMTKGGSIVYTLTEGESIEDVPPEYDVVIDPYAEPEIPEGGNGADGLSAYEIAVKNGFQGTEQEWLKSLKGKDGEDGQPGSPGKDGADGKDGYTPVKGKDYFTDAEKNAMVNAVIAALPVYNGEVVTV